MSADLLIWEPGFPLDPTRSDFIDQLDARAASERSQPSPTIQEFVAILTRRYPDLTEFPDGVSIQVTDTIWSGGPLTLYANGGSIELAMTMEGYGVGGEFILAVARQLCLYVYDPQGWEVYLPDGRLIRPPLPRARY